MGLLGSTVEIVNNFKSNNNLDDITKVNTEEELFLCLQEKIINQGKYLVGSLTVDFENREIIDEQLNASLKLLAKSIHKSRKK